MTSFVDVDLDVNLNLGLELEENLNLDVDLDLDLDLNQWSESAHCFSVPMNLLDETSTVVAPLELGVKVAVYTVLLVEEKELREPPLTVISPTAKSVVASLLVKVNASVASFVLEPLDTALPPAAAVIAIVGAVPS